MDNHKKDTQPFYCRQNPRKLGLVLFIFSQICIILLIIHSMNTWNIAYQQKVYKYNKVLENQSRKLIIKGDHSNINNSFHTAGHAEPHKKQHNWNETVSEAISEYRAALYYLNTTSNENCFHLCGKPMNASLINLTYQTIFDENYKMDTSYFDKLLWPIPSNQSFCDGDVVIHYNSFGLLKNIAIVPFRWNVTANLVAAGKELYNFKDFLLRTDDAEYVKPFNGLLNMYCPHIGGSFNNETKENIFHLKYLLPRTLNNYLDNDKPPQKDRGFDIEYRFSVAILRVDYANLFNVMLHAYNIFTLLVFQHQRPDNMTLLVMDSHPQAQADPILQTLYGPFIRMSNLRRPLKYQSLLLSLAEGNSFLWYHWYRESIPHLEEFRNFVINRHGLTEETSLDCNNLKITILWRRNKVYHPRNLKGSVFRKIFNEMELYKALREKYPKACVQGLLPDSLPFREQLRVIRSTDILIGMHGAGLSHALFLPATSGLLELFPNQWRARNSHYPLFEAIARWRGLHYMFWENDDTQMAMPEYCTLVDIKAALQLTDKLVHKICIKDLKTEEKRGKE